MSLPVSQLAERQLAAVLLVDELMRLFPYLAQKAHWLGWRKVVWIRFDPKEPATTYYDVSQALNVNGVVLLGEKHRPDAPDQWLDPVWLYRVAAGKATPLTMAELLDYCSLADLRRKVVEGLELERSNCRNRFVKLGKKIARANRLIKDLQAEHLPERIIAALQSAPQKAPRPGRRERLAQEEGWEDEE